MKLRVSSHNYRKCYLQKCGLWKLFYNTLARADMGHGRAGEVSEPGRGVLSRGGLLCTGMYRPFRACHLLMLCVVRCLSGGVWGCHGFLLVVYESFSYVMLYGAYLGLSWVLCWLAVNNGCVKGTTVWLFCDVVTLHAGSFPCHFESGIFLQKEDLCTP